PIGSKRNVQELRLVTNDSRQERILRLHDTKRDVLANIWDKGNQDTIAAPGGSGAFREMVASLLRAGPAQSTGSAPTPAPAADAPVPSSGDAAAEPSDLPDAASPDPASIPSSPAVVPGEVRSTTSI